MSQHRPWRDAAELNRRAGVRRKLIAIKEARVRSARRPLRAWELVVNVAGYDLRAAPVDVIDADLDTRQGSATSSQTSLAYGGGIGLGRCGTFHGRPRRQARTEGPPEAAFATGSRCSVSRTGPNPCQMMGVLDGAGRLVRQQVHGHGVVLCIASKGGETTSFTGYTDLPQLPLAASRLAKSGRVHVATIWPPSAKPQAAVKPVRAETPRRSRPPTGRCRR